MWDELRAAPWRDRVRFVLWTVGGAALFIVLPWVMWAVVA